MCDRLYTHSIKTAFREIPIRINFDDECESHFGNRLPFLMRLWCFAVRQQRPKSQVIRPNDRRRRRRRRRDERVTLSSPAWLGDRFVPPPSHPPLVPGTGRRREGGTLAMDLPPTRSSSSGGPADQTIAIQNFPHCIAGSLSLSWDRGAASNYWSVVWGRGIAALFRKRFSRTGIRTHTILHMQSSALGGKVVLLHENDRDRSCVCGALKRSYEFFGALDPFERSYAIQIETCNGLTGSGVYRRIDLSAR